MKCANIECGVEFKLITTRQKYCSDKCQEKTYNKSHYTYVKKQPIRNCKYCNVSIPSMGSTKYCSKECYRMSSNLRRREYYKKHAKKFLKRLQPKIKCAHIDCGAEFHPSPKQHYCSKKCHKLSYRGSMKMTHICTMCNNQFTSTNKTKIYCSKKCRRKSHLVKSTITKCAYCNNLYMKKREGTMYCSKECFIKSAPIRYRKNRETLLVSDNYIKRVLNVAGLEYVSPQIIKQKRLQLKIKRLTNEKQRVINTSGSNGRAV